MHQVACDKEPRWVVEWTFEWLSQFRRLGVHYTDDPNIHAAFFLAGFGR
jgi:hypothetical protein